MIVYSNSCSFGVVSDGKVYSQFIADRLNARLVNNGLSGSCNERIFRTTIRDLLELKEKTTEEILVLLSVSSLYRHEYWGSNKSSDDGNFQSFQISSLSDKTNNYPIEIKEYAKQWLICQTDYEALMLKLYYNLVLLVTFLRANNFKYLIWAGPNDIFKNFDEQTPFIKTFSDFCRQSNIIPFTEFNFCNYCLQRGHVPIDYDRYGNNGHPGEQGHKEFADLLLEKYLHEISFRH